MKAITHNILQAMNQMRLQADRDGVKIEKIILTSREKNQLDNLIMRGDKTWWPDGIIVRSDEENQMWLEADEGLLWPAIRIEVEESPHKAG